METLVELNDELNHLLTKKSVHKSISKECIERIAHLKHKIDLIKSQRQINLQKAIENEGRGSLIFIHIGKCGGGSLWNALEYCEALRQEFPIIAKVHMRKPPILVNAKYIFIFRDPVERAISAFNWRYEKLVLEKNNITRKTTEHRILEKYKSINRLSENLYKNDHINQQASKEFQQIRHIDKNFSYYLSDLFSFIKKDNVYKKIDIEELTSYLQQLLPSDERKTSGHTKHKSQPTSEKVDKATIVTLKKYFAPDYEVLKRYDTLT